MSSAIQRLDRNLVRIRFGPRGLVLSIAALVIVSVLALVYATRLGPWIFSDSVEYIVSARNLLNGRGVGLILPSGQFQPIYLHPPFYPLALAAVGTLGIDLVIAARWMNILFFGLIILLAAGIIYYATGSSWLPFGAGLLFMFNPALAWVSAGAMSEPIFVVSGLVGLLLLLKYFETGSRRLLLIAGVASGMAALARYPGVALVATGWVGIALFSQSRRASDAVLFTILAGVPILVWLVYVSAQPTVGLLGQSAFRVADLWKAWIPLRIGLVDTIWAWIPFHEQLPSLPYRPKPRLIFAAGLVLASMAVIAARRIGRRGDGSWRQNRAFQLIALLSAFALASVAFLAISFAFSAIELDQENVDERILLPVQLAVALGLLAATDLFLKAWPKQRWIGALAGGVVALTIASYLPRTSKMLSDLHDNGAGIGNWRGSATVREVGALPSSIPIITNESAILLFYLDRPAYDLPELIGHEVVEPFTRLGDGDSEADRVFREEGAALALFFSVPYQFYWIYFEDTEERLAALTEGLHIHSDLGDGTIYFYEKPGE
ncbi:MAG: ArnT family glycosyltransferase [Anaerolineales bacterium]